MLGILYWPVLPFLFSSLSSEGSCLLPTSLCVCFISPHYTFFLRRLHPVSRLQLKGQSRDLVSKTSSNPYFIQVIIKVPFLWMHNALTWQGTGLYLSPNLSVQLYVVALLVRASYTMLSPAMEVFQCFKLLILPQLKPALHLYLLPHFLYSQVMVIIELKNVYSQHFFLFILMATILLRI